ncbi:signal peptide peptidase SppA [bacterium]|nr:signal peptide peptidase SppA [bacterium]
MTKQKEWLIGLGIATVTIVLIAILASIKSGSKPYDGVSISSRGDKIAVVELFGTITESGSIVEQFQEYGENESVKAILFHINSGGGLVAASQEIYETVRRIRDGGKPVVVSMESVAASGGYYVACGADTIMANPGTTTGSIGVIAEFVNLTDLMEKMGIQYEVIKSGRFKDTGSPFRDPTPADKNHLQNWVDDAYQQFVDVVVRERKLPREKVLELADGRIFTGRQAYEQGLIDLLGDYEEAVRLTAQLGGIKGKPKIVKLRRSRFALFDLFFQKIEGILQGVNQMSLKYSLY